jgi:putative membrane protein
MDKAALVFAGLAGVVHVYIWVMESLTWRKPATWKRFGVASQEEAETQRTFAYNQGFYNLFLAIGAMLGVACVVLHNGVSTAGWTLIFFACSCMFGAALVLLSSGSGTQYARPAMMQGMLPLLAIVAGIAALA